MKWRQNVVIKLLLLLFASALIQLNAGFIKFWQLKETAAAPVLIVARATSIQADTRALVEPKSRFAPMIAEFEVLRSFGEAPAPKAGARIHLEFKAIGPNTGGLVNEAPPPLSGLKTGDILVLPLQEPQALAPEYWRLISETGVGLTIPAFAASNDSEPPKSPRAFVLREVAAVLSSGSEAEQFTASSYLLHQQEDLSAEIFTLIEPMIGMDRQRWAKLAASLLAVHGVPRPTLTQIFASPVLQRLKLARLVLLKLGQSEETNRLLIGAWMNGAPHHTWGSAQSLLEFGDHPLTTQSLRQSLINDETGSSFVAYLLAKYGHHATLPEALARAMKVIDRPSQPLDHSDLHGAAELIRDFGSEQDLKKLADLVRKYQSLDRNHYQLLWQLASGGGNTREVRVLEVVLQDRTVAFGEYRYCDLAVGALERAVGQSFGSSSNPTSLKERDAALQRALAWIAASGR